MGMISEQLDMLGLATDDQPNSSSTATNKRKAAAKKKKAKPETAPARVSKRNRGVQPDYSGEHIVRIFIAHWDMFFIILLLFEGMFITLIWLTAVL